MSNGVILFEGPSLLDGAPIVVIAIGTRQASSNRKTGGMLQTYILRRDVSPVGAVRTGEDFSICGNCVHRGSSGDGRGRTCYVQYGQGPTVVWKTYQAGKYPRVDRMHGLGELAAVGAGRLVRLGTYGDPAAAPLFIWQALLSAAAGHTGYTHQWRTAPGLRTLCMASVDTPEEAIAAQGLGWRTFRVAASQAPSKGPGESLCPASEEAGRKLTCERCLACAGADGRRGSIYIPAHGGSAVMANVARLGRG